ncbi:MAG TPA: FAD binding domain-containing protein [Longilinea sp.]|nr:FAD binding domain-containing protein [Longilinea sp.]
MIVEYHRPATISQALELLSRKDPKSLPLGGGSTLSRDKRSDFAVVDLQALGLDTIQVNSEFVEIGATARIQGIVEDTNSPLWLKVACNREMGRNMREMSTIAGFVMGATGRSPLAIALLAADLQVSVLPTNDKLTFLQVLSERANIQQPWVISQVMVDRTVNLKYEFIARSPEDLPVIGIALAKWPTGRIRASVGGFGNSPSLAYDGNNPAAVTQAVETTLIGSGDRWASEEYRQSIAPAIVQRLLAD